jgi:hypothetical protein
MPSYAEDILRMACQANGPSIKDMDVIWSFQAHPMLKDAVSVGFNIVFLRMGCSIS